MAEKGRKKSLVGYIASAALSYFDFHQDWSGEMWSEEVAIAKEAYERKRMNWIKVRITIEEL